MKSFSCPSCGAEVQFKVASNISLVCVYCHSLLIRHNLVLENLGKEAQLQDSPGLLQLGTGGTYQRNAFSLVGKIRWDWEGGFWNEWFAYLDNGSTGWLAEAQGFLSFSVKLSERLSAPALSDLHAGLTMSITGKPFSVDDIKDCECKHFEGELPINPLGAKKTNVDLRGDGEAYANIEYSEGQTNFYLGQYLEFDAFRFSNLRSIEGW